MWKAKKIICENVSTWVEKDLLDNIEKFYSQKQRLINATTLKLRTSVY